MGHNGTLWPAVRAYIGVDPARASDTNTVNNLRTKCLLPNFTQPKYSMIRKLVLCGFVFIWGGCGVSAAQAMFSTERRFGPVRLSQEQLLELVDRLRSFAEQQGPTPAASDDATQILSLSDGQSTLRISEEISMETLDSAPPIATSVSYEYRNRTGVISSIRLRLSDVSRTLDITGRSRDQVEAAASVASSIISQSRTAVGGLVQRAFGAAVLIVVGLILALTPASFAFRAKCLGTAAGRIRSHSFSMGVALEKLVPWISSLSR